MFGRIIAGWDFIENTCVEVERKEEKPIKPITIYNAGELRFEDKLVGARQEPVGEASDERGLWTGPLEFLNNYDRNVYAEEERLEAQRAEKRKLRAA